jgi:hypothetical protein
MFAYAPDGIRSFSSRSGRGCDPVGEYRSYSSGLVLAGRAAPLGRLAVAPQLGACSLILVQDRMEKLLDHRFLTRLGNLRTLVSLAGAVALVLIAVILAAIKLFTGAGWVPLLFVGLALVVAFVLVAERVRSKQRSQVQATVTTFYWEDRPDGKVILQAVVVVLNAALRATRLNRWGLSGQFDGADRNAVHLRGWQRFEGREPLPKLDIDTANNPLSPGEEREGYVSFVFPHTTSAAVQESVLTLSVHDEQGRRSVVTIDIPALKALGEHTVKN